MARHIVFVCLWATLCGILTAHYIEPQPQSMIASALFSAVGGVAYAVAFPLTGEKRKRKEKRKRAPSEAELTALLFQNLERQQAAHRRMLDGMRVTGEQITLLTEQMKRAQHDG